MSHLTPEGCHQSLSQLKVGLGPFNQELQQHVQKPPKKGLFASKDFTLELWKCSRNCEKNWLLLARNSYHLALLLKLLPSEKASLLASEPALPLGRSMMSFTIWSILWSPRSGGSQVPKRRPPASRSDTQTRRLHHVAVRPGPKPNQ